MLLTIALIQYNTHTVVYASILVTEPAGLPGNTTTNTTGSVDQSIPTANITGFGEGLGCDPNVPWSNCGGGHE